MYQCAKEITPDIRAEARNRVLVVDDDSGICDIVSRMLEHLGHKPVAVRSGLSAVAEFDRGKFDLVILDVDMPQMSGEQVYAVIRDRQEEQPVVFMTGYRTEELASTLNGDDAVGFLAKPFPLAKLRTTMDALLEGGVRE